MSTEDKIALFDMDGTLADYDQKLAQDLALLRHTNEPEEDLNWTTEDERPDYIKARIRLVKSQPGWWESLAEIPSGFLLLWLAKKVGFTVHVLTKGPRRLPFAWGEKLQWCQKHIAPDVDITITHDKGIVYGRVLVDDYPEYMDRWLKHRPRGLGLMPATDYNVGYQHSNVIRYPLTMVSGDLDYLRIKRALEKVYER